MISRSDQDKAIAHSDADVLRWLYKQAQEGNADAQFNLGVIYGKGRGVDQDGNEAVRWYRKAADQGHVDAQNNLGVMLLNGMDVSRKRKRGRYLVLKAIRRQHNGIE